jgi:hypothetical protein
MTVLLDDSQALDEITHPVAGNESMQAVLAAIRYDLSLDTAKTEKQIKKRMSDLTTAVNHIAKSLRTTLESLTVSEAAENESTFLDYVAQTSLSPASKMQLPATRNTVLRYARCFGFSPSSFAFLDEWDPVLKVLSAEHGATAIAHDAIRRKRRRIDFSDADLDVWAEATLDAKRTYSHVRNARAAFLTEIREAGVQGLVPQLDVSVHKPPGFKLRMEKMLDPLRDEISRIVDARRTLAAQGRVSMALATEREIIEHFEDFCGYAVRVCGVENLVSLEPLLNEPFVTQHAFWLRKERKCKRTTIVGRLSRMFAALETSPDFEHRDLSWVRSVYRKLRPEPESALKQRRRNRHIEFLELVAILRRMRGEREARKGESSRSLGWRVMDELLLACLILGQYPPRFVREAVLGVNLFKGPIPKDGPPFKIPAWAEESLRKNPSAQFWQFNYKSVVNGELHRGLVLSKIVPLLRLYLKRYRRLFVHPDNKRVFCNRSGKPMSCSSLGNLVSYRVWHYARKRATPTSIRSSFAHYFRAKYPHKDAVLAKMQWLDYPTIKLRYDEEFRKQRAARVYRRKKR